MEAGPFPDWVDETLSADDAFAAAYAAVGGARRAWMKLAVARLAACFGEAAYSESLRVRRMRQGFGLRTAARPVDWAVIAWDEGHTAPARLLAALMPAVLAGTAHILACRIRAGGEAAPMPQALLAAMELAGQELVADMDMDQAASLFSCLGAARAAGRPGRAVFLGDAAFAEATGRMARGARVPAMHFGPVRIGIDPDGLPDGHAAPPYGALGFAHPDAEFVPAEDAEGPFDAVFCAESRAGHWLSRCPFAVTPGHEACWVWPGLSPGFFVDRAMALCP